MKWLLDNKKIGLIIVLVLLCGLLLQISRSQFALNTVKNQQLLDENLIHLIPTTESFSVSSNPDYCILYDETSISLKENLEQTLEYMQKTYFSFAENNFSLNTSGCSNIILTTGYLKHLGAVADIENFVFDGGNLFLMHTLELDSHFQILAPLLGVIDSNGFTVSTSITMTSNLLISANNMTFLDNILEDSSLNIHLSNKIEPLMVNQNNNPIIWRSTFGKGGFMIFNATFIKEKVSRGVIVGMLSKMEDTYIYPIFNSKTFYIDDFPSPIPKARNKIIYDEYHMDLPTFYQNIWWPDMLQTASKYNLVYTGALNETYNDRVTPPFDLNNENEINYLIRFGRELIKSGGELGFHGYNHQSLTLDEKISKQFGYNAWQSVDHMQQSLEELLDYTATALPSYKITSYVPPSNVLSQEGRTILKETLPDLVVIASLYNHDVSNLSYIQEFEIAPDSIVEMPRISSGYQPTATAYWDIINTISHLGVYSHFLHPDDVISEDRNFGKWSEMHKQFESFMNDIDEWYPWLNSLTATESAFNIAAALQTKITLEVTDDLITGEISNFSKDAYFILRTPKKIKSNNSFEIEKIDTDTYLVKVLKSNFQIKINEG